MLGTLFNNPLSFFYWLGALVIGITVHEFAHAYLADRLGDPTPRLQGRLTLNPMAHLDPLGTLLLILAHFGWGKPVQFDPFNLQSPRRDAALISLAGPVTNLIVAVLSSIVLRLVLLYSPASYPHMLIGISHFLIVQFLPVLISMNVILAIFNLVPIHPLDGFKIVGGILPREYARQWYELEPYGMIFLLALVFPLFGGVAPVQRIISPIINTLISLLVPTIGSAGII